MTGSPTIRLGKYRVLEHVAEGPLAEVLSARLEGIAGFSRKFAIKRLKPELAGEPEAVSRFEEQARRAAALAHGNIAQVLDLGRDGDRPFAVVEWVDGWDLGRVLARAREVGTPIPVSHAAWIGWQITKALEYAHERQTLSEGTATVDPFVHGALGPEDVLLSRGGEVKVSDFGLARAADELARVRPRLVATRPDRATPEQLAGQPAEIATDLFAAAVIIYQCLTLEHPFRREGEAATRAAIQAGASKPLAEARPDVPPALARLVDAALSANPAARPASATLLKTALAEAAHPVGGDVFTQEKLASWAKQLFGEVDLWSDAKVTRQLDEGALELDPDGPVTSPEVPDLPEGASDDLVSMTSTPDRTEPLGPKHLGSRTLVDDSGAHDAIEDRTAVGEVREAIRSAQVTAPKNAGLPPSALESQRSAPAWEEAGVAVVEAEAATQVDALRHGQQGAVARLEAPEAPEVVPLRLRLQGAASGLGLLVLGALLGGALVLGAVRSGALVPTPPVLDLRGPPDAGVRFTVDGQAVDGPREVEVGAHAIEISLPSGALYKVEVPAAAGEYRLLLLEPVALPAPEEPTP